jgi:uncharacterized protein YpuA (DUF1002 family)
MIETREGLLVSQEQLSKLRAMEERVINNQNRDPRLKKSELAGIRSMIAQIEREIRVYNFARLQDSINELDQQVKKLNSEELPTWLFQSIRTMKEMAEAVQPVI